MKEFFITIFWQPIYNLLILLIDIVPGGNMGVAIILTTLIVKFILMPLAKKASYTQIVVKEIQPQIKELQQKYKDDRQKLGLETIALYKKHNISPFSGLLTMFIQIPVILSLFFIFSRAGLPQIISERVYSFILVPGLESVSVMFLNIDLTGKSLILAILTAVTQYLYTSKIMPKPEKKKKTEGENVDNPESNKVDFKEEFQKSMSVQMRYGMPILIFFVAWSLPSAVALYWIVSNVFGYIQDGYVKSHVDKMKIKMQEAEA